MKKKDITDGLRTETKNGNALISNDFFKKIRIKLNEVYPMVVMATMSSGKSTLINSLLGTQLLPNRNEACTAKVYAILDDDRSSDTQIYITHLDGNVTVINERIVEELNKANNDSDVSDILIRGQIKGVINTDKALLIIDTPGPNNSRDESHEMIVKNVLEKLKGGLILYVLNATQFGINDDMILLKHAKEYLKNNSNASILFVLNKVDQLDEERGESVKQLVMLAKEYLISNGIVDPTIIPVSALAAGLFKKVLNEEQLTRNEYRLFINYYEMYFPHDFNMTSFAITYDLPDQNRIISLQGKEYVVGNLKRAIENTGIKLLEEEIQKAQIQSGKTIKNTIKVYRR